MSFHCITDKHWQARASGQRVWARRLGAAVAASLFSLAAQAAPKQVEAFRAEEWQQLQAQLKQPAIVVFSSTDCVHCPGVLQDLAANRQRQRLKVPVIAVVIDQEPGTDDAALLSNPHYRKADRLMAFEGQSAALRYAVNPQWRGMTPYIALLKPGSAARFVVGPPDATELRAWLDSKPR
ncbi:thioredoxin [Paucibacter sp. Y2R2-4]|uniref:thioredoxin n=1 Tax=Paucibacter sp. Y2R2-4 TaxID=2893553 RepID=UPI0021E40A82|nr:thioredoxin [Paucibacter sp. Y2R2-4]MCV2352304.1 thioredoxin [Paucibacter sp. Y2R2-4]